MRILHISHYLPPNGDGGVQNYTLQLAQAQAALGHEVAIYARGIRSDVPAGTEETATRFDGLRVVESHLGPRGHFAHQRQRTLQATAFRKFAVDFQPNVVHFQHLLYHSIDYPQIARDLGATTVLTLHDLWYTCPTVQRIDYRGEVCARAPGGGCLPCIWNGRRADVISRNAISRIAGSRATAPLLNLIPTSDDLIDWAVGSRECLRSVDLVISPSQFYADNLRANGIAHPNVVIADCGIAAPAPADDLAPEPPADGTIRFGVIGTHRLKGASVAIDAFRTLTDRPVELLWYGGDESDGPGKLPPSVRVMGKYDAADLERVFGSFDVLIAPSIWWENSMLVIREAFARGKPVITSDMAGMAESVRDGVDGLLFPAGDAAALNACIRRFQDEPDLLEGLRAGIRPPKFMNDHVAELDALYAGAGARRPIGEA